MFNRISLPPPELASAAYLTKGPLGDHLSRTTGGERELRMASPPQASNKHPQQKTQERQPRAVSFQLPPGLARPALPSACPCELSDLAWQQPALHPLYGLQPTALHPLVAQQPASAMTALREQVIEPTSRRHTSEEELGESHAAVTDAQLHASFEDDLSLFSAEEIKKAKEKAGESLRGTCESVPRASFTAQQLKHVIQTTWAIQQQSSQDGEASLKARILDKSFQHRIFDLDMAACTSAPSHMSLKILLTLSLINRWDVITANLSSALLPASEALVLVEPPPELAQRSDVLWKITRALYGIEHSPRLWQQHLANKLEELGLRRNKVEPCIFSSEQLIVMLHLDALLIEGDKHQQESCISQLSTSISLTDIIKLDAKTPLSFLNMTLEHSKQDHSISLHLPASSYMKLFKMYGMENAKAISTLEDQLCQSEGQRKYSKPLASARQKLYRTAFGQLLWTTQVRPDLSFAVNELSRSLQASTRQDEQQLKKVLRYLKGTLHFTTSLQPPRKKVIERASSIHIQACFDSTLEGSNQKKKASKWSYPIFVGSSFGSFH